MSTGGPREMNTRGPREMNTGGPREMNSAGPRDESPAESAATAATTSDVTTSVAPAAAKQSILANSAVMAAGTLFSRFSGVFRSILLAAALGSVAVSADAFTLANTVPNMLYILLAGGVFNAVLVPQLVRALKEDPDGGVAYTNRIMTLGLLFLAVVTVALVVFAPALMRVFLDARWYAADMSAALDSVITLARWCLPQVFFYGMFTLVGQVLNSRGVFGPMMWAPIANNVISVGVLLTYLLVFGPASGVVKQGDFTSGQMALLGLGSTAGIAVQLLVLVPFMRKAGFRFRPRFDFKGTGLSHTMRLAVWTILFVVVNQVAYTVVVRLLSDATASGVAGQTVYSNAWMITLLPHGVVTVSLVTALLPRLSAYAADDQGADLARTLTSTLRTALVVILPFAALLPVLGTDMANAIYGWGASAGDADAYGGPLAFFGLALLFYTVHYFMLRGFYALEQTRTVFFIQCALAAVNIGAGVLLVRLASDAWDATVLAGAYALAYAVGAAISWLVLRRTLGGLEGRRMLRYLVRAVVVVLATTAISFGLWFALLGWREDVSPLLSIVRGGVVGVVHLVVFVVLARLFRIAEVSELLDPVLRSVRRRLGRG